MQAGSVEIVISANDQGATTKLKKVGDAAKEAAKKTSPVDDAFKKVSLATQGLNSKLDSLVGGYKAAGLSSKQVSANLATLRADLLKAGMPAAELDAHFKRLEASGNGLGAATNYAKAAIAGLGVTAGIHAAGALKDAGLAAERLRRTLEFASGGAMAGRDAFAFVSAEANRLGVNLLASADSYAQLAAAAKGTRLEGEATRELFSGMAQASATLGLTADQTKGALNAFQQMISKGTVQAEELRGQLGERLPGAFQIAARSMGMTTQELGKALEKGEVFAEDLIPKMAAELKNTFPPAADSASQSLERFGNVIQGIKAEAGAGFASTIGKAAQALLDFGTPAEVLEKRRALSRAYTQEERAEAEKALKDAEERAKKLSATFGKDRFIQERQAREDAERAQRESVLAAAKALQQEEAKKTLGPSAAQQAVIDKLKEEEEAKRKADAKASIEEAKRSADLQIEIENRVLESKRMARQKLKEMSKAATSPEARQGIADDEARTARAYARLEGDAARAARDLKIGAMKEGNAKELELINAREQDEVNAFRLSSAAKYMAAEEREASLTAIAQRYSNERKAISAAENQAIASASIGLAANVGQALQAMAGKNRAMAKAGMRLTQASAIASTAAGVAKAFEQGGVLGFITGAGIAAAGAAQVATIEQQINRFADGGIVPGTSTSGDRVPAMVNSKEMILTQQHQAGLWNFINGKGGAGAGNGGVSIGDIVINLPAGASEEDGRRAGRAASDTILSRLRGHVRDSQQAEYLGVRA